MLKTVKKSAGMLSRFFNNKWFRRIGPRVALFYFAVVLLAVSLSMVIFNGVISEYALQRLRVAADQTIAAVRSNVNLTLSKINDYSRLIFTNSKLQTLLRKGAVNRDLSLQSRVQVYLYSLIQAEPVIDSVFIFDFDNRQFSVSKREPTRFLLEDVENAPWFEQVIAEKGRYVLALDGDGVFATKPPGGFVSMIRLVRDVNYASNLGIMVVNISNEAFLSALETTFDRFSQRIAVVDRNNRYVVKPGGFDEQYASILHEVLEGPNNAERSAVHRFGKVDYIVSRLLDPENQWEFIGITNVSHAADDSQVFGYVTALLIALNGLILFGASIILSNIYARPIRHLMETMKMAQSGSYVTTKQRANSEEFDQLFRGYNKMITRLKELHEKHISEQDTARKAELRVLQSQIKPHFLYNTLDSIVSLGLLGANDEVVELSRALSDYYRMSVSKGRDILTLGEELEIVKNYLIIQKIRYQDKYRVHYDIDESCLNMKIPKLVLQPLVENAIYHGIRAKKTSGNIRIMVRREIGHISVIIADDGIGMSEEQIKTNLQGRPSGEGTGFGLWGTIERVRIFYGEDTFRIQSSPGEGTLIFLNIPEEG